MNEKPKKRLEGPAATMKTLLFWLLLAGLVGLVCGLVGGAFHIVLDYAGSFREAHDWLLWLLPAAGLIIVWSYRTAGMENDSGTNQIIASVRGETRPPLRLAALIFCGTALTHLTGGSAGREGAALQIGGSLAAALGKWCRISSRNMSIIVQCGMSGLFAALFGTPLTAAVFCLEVVSVGIIHYSALLPSLISACLATAVTRSMGIRPEGYELLGLPAVDLGSMGKVAALAVLCALLAIVFCVVMHKTAHLYNKYLPNQYIRVVVGGGIIIALTLLLGTRDYNGAGSAVIEHALTGQAVPWAFAVKLIFTALTLGAGYRGGEIVPTFFVGSTFGCAAAPLLGLDPAFGAAIAMVALFCGVVNCPLASILLSVELFGSEGLLFFGVACAISFLISGRFSLYSSQKIVYSKLEPKFINENAK